MQRIAIRDTERLAEAGIDPAIGSFGNIPSARAEANHRAALEATPMAAQVSNEPASGNPGTVQVVIRLY